MTDQSPFPSPDEVESKFQKAMLEPLLKPLRDAVRTAFQMQVGPVYKIYPEMVFNLLDHRPTWDLRQAAIGEVMHELRESGWAAQWDPSNDQRDPDSILIQRPTSVR